MPKRRRAPRAPKPRADELDDYVVHPRYGQRPRLTGLHPVRPATFGPGDPLVKFHWHSPEELGLIEASVFSRRQTERVRMLLRRVPARRARS